MMTNLILLLLLLFLLFLLLLLGLLVGLLLLLLFLDLGLLLSLLLGLLLGLLDLLLLDLLHLDGGVILHGGVEGAGPETTHKRKRSVFFLLGQFHHHRGVCSCCERRERQT